MNNLEYLRPYYERLVKATMTPNNPRLRQRFECAESLFWDYEMGVGFGFHDCHAKAWAFFGPLAEELDLSLIDAEHFFDYDACRHKLLEALVSAVTEGFEAKSQAPMTDKEVYDETAVRG